MGREERFGWKEGELEFVEAGPLPLDWSPVEVFREGKRVAWFAVEEEARRWVAEKPDPEVYSIKVLKQ